MFPVSDVIPSRTRPYVTVGLIAINTLAFFYEWQLSDRELQRLLRQFGTVPADLSAAPLLTGMFLHAGWLHIGANMLYLWIFGDNVEDRFGHGRFLAFYLFCGVVAVLGQVSANPYSFVPITGASGAVAGVMGAYFVLYPRSRVLTAIIAVFFYDLVEIPAIFFLGVWVVLQLFSSVGSIGAASAVGSVAFWSQISGFLTGLCFGAFARWRDAGADYWRVAPGPGSRDRGRLP
jgi:membrane associated rhomboid family serine protease